MCPDYAKTQTLPGKSTQVSGPKSTPNGNARSVPQSGGPVAGAQKPEQRDAYAQRPQGDT